MIYTNLISRNFKILALIALSVVYAQSQTPFTARILGVEGTVKISRASTIGASSQVKARIGDEVTVGDVIKTSIGGRLVIKLTDGSQAVISENTTVEIKDFNNSPRTIFNVLRGRTRVKIEKLGGKPNPYRITTPTTVIAVRGTIFDVFVKDEETKVFVVEGEVGVSNLLMTAGEVFLIPGQFTRVRKETPPSPPASFKPERNDEFFKPIAEQRRGRSSPFDDSATDNPGRSGNAPGRNSENAPGNSGNKGRRGKN